MTVARRLTSTGSVFISGEFDEITHTSIKLTTANYFAAEFDEVTFSSISLNIVNQLIQTENLSITPWGLAGVLISNDVELAPNNTNTADKIVETASTTHYLLQDSTLVSGTRYVQSVFAKSSERTFFHLTPSIGFTTSDCWANFNLTTGASSIQGANTLGMTAGTINVGQGWWRCWISMPATASGAGRIAFGPTDSLVAGRLGPYTGDGVSGVFAWGAQLEVGSTPSIYQGISTSNILVTPNFVAKEERDGKIYIIKEFNEVDKPV
jgi:hypothetical protein